MLNCLVQSCGLTCFHDQSSIGQTNGFLVVNSNFMMKFLYETSGRSFHQKQRFMVEFQISAVSCLDKADFMRGALTISSLT